MYYVVMDLLSPLVLFSSPDFDSQVEKMLEFHSNVMEKAKTNISNAQQKQKDHYDKRHAGTSSIAIGSIVLLANEARKGGKQDPLWLGPYIVEDLSDKGVCKLRNRETGNTLQKQYNVSLLTLFKEKPGSSDKKRPLDQKSSKVSVYG